MKKFILSGLMIVFMMGSIIAQETQSSSPEQKMIKKERNNYVGISLGASLPMGDFKDAEFVKTGVTFAIDYGHKFNKNFGLMLKWFGSANNFDTEAASESFYDLVTFDKATIAFGGLLGGVTIHFPMEDVIFDIKALGGYMSMKNPEYNYWITGSPFEWAVQSEADATSFGFALGAGFTFMLSDKWSLNISGEYNAAKFEYENVGVLAYDGSYQSFSGTTEYNAVNILAGVHFHF